MASIAHVAKPAPDEEEKVPVSPACGKRSALLVISMQNDFVLASSPLCLPTAAPLIPAIQQAVSFARQRSALIVWVVREHHQTGRDVELFRRAKFAGLNGAVLRGTEGAALVDGLEPLPEDHVLVKSRFSAFFATNLHLVLQAEAIENVILIGIMTPNCIRQTAFDAVAHNYPSVVVLSDVTASRRPEVQEANLYDMRKVKIATPSLEEWMAIE